MKYAYMIFWTLRDYKFEQMMKLPKEEREKVWKARLEKQSSMLKENGVKLDYWGPAWGAEHDYVTVVKSDKAWDEMNTILGQWNDDWVKTKTIAVSVM